MNFPPPIPAKRLNLANLWKQTADQLSHTVHTAPAPSENVSDSVRRDRRETDRSPANRGKSATHYFVEAVARAWCPAGDFERRLQRTVPGRPLVALEAKLGLLLRLVEVGLISHRQAREMAERLTTATRDEVTS